MVTASGSIFYNCLTIIMAVLHQILTSPVCTNSMMTNNQIKDGRRHLIVVDDNVLLLEVTSQILREFTNVDIVSFSNPTDALRAFASQPDYYDLIVTDLEMPEL